MKRPPEKIEDDPKFSRGIELFNRGDYFDAGEEFEDLFFEAVRDEVDFIRVFLQVSVGIHHVERGQLSGAVERLQEGIRVISRVENDRGWDLSRLASEIEAAIEKIHERSRGERKRIEWPRIERRE